MDLRKKVYLNILVKKLIEFQIIDNKPIFDHIHEFKIIVYDMKLKGIVSQQEYMYKR